MNQSGEMSNQIDILIYNSTFYAPIYAINNLVIIPPEAVIIAIEVKTRINKQIFHEVISKNRTLKMMDCNIESQVFIYNPPSSEKIMEYLNAFDYTDYDGNCLIDKICGLNKFYISKENIKTEEEEGIGYINQIYKSKGSDKDAIFELFCYNIYRIIETNINMDLKKGIDNVWVLSKDSAINRGRLRYSNISLNKVELGSILIKKELKK